MTRTIAREIPYTFQARAAKESKISFREQLNYLKHLVIIVSGSPEDRRFFLFCAIGLLGTLVNLAIYVK